MNKQTEALKMAQEVPLIERLRSVPENARLIVDSIDGMSSNVYPVGYLCHKAAEALEQIAQEPDLWARETGIKGTFDIAYPWNKEQYPSEYESFNIPLYACELPVQEPVAWTYENLGRMEKEGVDLANELADIHIAGDATGALNSRIVKSLRMLSMTVFHQAQKICELTVKNIHPSSSGLTAPSWQGLTDDEIEKVIQPMMNEFVASGRTTINFARAIEQALRTKNEQTN